MSAKGRSPDNAAAEGFLGRLKQEFFHKRSFQGVSIDEFITLLDEYMVWYRDKRIKCVCSIESGPCERVDVFHVSGRFWSTSACGEKRTPARPAWTSFPS